MATEVAAAHWGQRSVEICDDVADANGKSFGGVRLSSKLLKALEILCAMPPGERGVVFSWFKSALDLLEAALEYRGVSVARLDGDDDKETRKDVMEIFQARTPGSARVLLATKTSGGVGLTLTAANHMVLLDGWWNPAVDEQAIDRLHRITQTRPVHVHLLFCKDTFDEVIRDIAARKAQEACAALGDGDHAAMLGGKAALSASGLSDRDYSAIYQGLQRVQANRLANQTIGAFGVGGGAGPASAEAAEPKPKQELKQEPKKEMVSRDDDDDSSDGDADAFPPFVMPRPLPSFASAADSVAVDPRAAPSSCTAEPPQSASRSTEHLAPRSKRKFELPAGAEVFDLTDD